MRKRSSFLWTITKDEYLDILNRCNTFSEILRIFNMSTKGGNIKTLKRVLNEYKIDYSKIATGLNCNKGKKREYVSDLSNEELFTANSNHSRGAVKRRILKYKLIEYKCEQCGQLPIWNNKELVLVLDHINGIANDHRLENLRFLCPNCNSQQDTFCGKNLKVIPKSNIKKEKLKLFKQKLIEERKIRILNSNIDFSKFGWVTKVAKLENTTIRVIQRFMRKYLTDFYYSKCFIRKN